MESLYYVLCYACHRRCKHCYEDRFRPYRHEALEAVIAQAEANFPRIIDHLPQRMSFIDFDAQRADQPLPEKVGRIIVSGGEVLLEPVRKRVTYPALEQLRRRYLHSGGVKLIVQTTGDLLTPPIIDDLVERDVSMISVASLDAYHVGLDTPEKQAVFQEKLTKMFEDAGLRPVPEDASALPDEQPSPFYHFFGATPESWIGKLWPRGRGWQNGLSTATIADNFCNQWSGGVNFLQHRYSGSEVSIDPDGNVYPCCIKTRLAIGNLLERPLIDILESLIGNPVYEAISMGHPERMGINQGWSVEKFLEKSITRTPQGRAYQNLCIGCDKFHEEVLTPQRHTVKPL